jgi:hypothetical protein
MLCVLQLVETMLLFIFQLLTLEVVYKILHIFAINFNILCTGSCDFSTVAFSSYV